MKKYSAKELIKIREGLSYMSRENFTTAMNLVGIIDEYTIAEHFREMKDLNIFRLLEGQHDVILTAVLKFHDIVVEKAWKNSFVLGRKKVIKKIIFKQGEKVCQQEIDINSYAGAKSYCAIQENSEILTVLNMCDSVPLKNNQGYKNIFEGDVICNHDTFYRNRGSQVFLAFLSKGDLYPSPYYKKLIFTQEFGFINPANDEPLTEKNQYKFKESSFNTFEDGPYNYHCFTLGDHWAVIGNVLIDKDIFDKLK